MKYYIIAGEASGDLHAAHLMDALKKQRLFHLSKDGVHDHIELLA